MEPPPSLRRFYDEIKGLDNSSLKAHPAVLEAREFLNKTGGNSKLRQSLPRSRQLQHNYGAAQLACFDYVGYCRFCGGTSRHVHSIQGTSVYEIEGFPGVYIYPMLLRNYFALRNLSDQLLHRELALPSSLTNLHHGYHVTHPVSSTDYAPTSFFDPEASQIKMQPRIADSWVSSPITVQDFVQKLRWFSIRLPANIQHLVEGLIPLQVGNATAHISSPQDMLALRQHSQHSQQSGNQGVSLDLSLGCGGFAVLGRERRPDEHKMCGQPSSPTSRPDKKCYESNGGLSGEVDGGNAWQSRQGWSNAHCEEHDALQLAAIHLRHGDALLFCNEGMDTWHGVAKVDEGSFEIWEQYWHCWFEAGQDSWRQEWRGCMRSRRLDVFMQ